MESVGSIIMYLITALAIVIFSVLAVTTRKILRAATYLLFTLFATAAIYFQLDYEFLGAVQIAVYAGGEELASKQRRIGLLAAIAMLLVAGYSLVTRFSTFITAADNSGADMKEIGERLLGTGHFEYLLPFEAVSVLLLACIIGGIVVARKK